MVIWDDGWDMQTKGGDLEQLSRELYHNSPNDYKTLPQPPENGDLGVLLRPSC